MKQSVLILLPILIALTAQAHASRNPRPTGGVPESPVIRLIRTKFKHLESQREELKKTELTAASQPSAEGSRASVYRKGGKVLIVDESYFAEMGQAIWSFYFDGNRPFFVLVAETRYAFPITVTADERKKLGGGEDKTTENRYYFQRGKLIRWLEGKKAIPPRGGRFRDQAKSVLELATSAYRNALEGHAKR